MGLALTRHLIAQGWKVGMSDTNQEQGEALAKELDENALFVQADVRQYEGQAKVFEMVWAKWKRVDFGESEQVFICSKIVDYPQVAANAGIVDSFSLYEPPSTSEYGSPSKPNLKTIDVDLCGVIYTVYLALHYFRKNQPSGGKITMTASSAALYPVDAVPMYTAAKHAVSHRHGQAASPYLCVLLPGTDLNALQVLGLTRAMAPVVHLENITINCLCPGLIETALTESLVDAIPRQYVTPMSTVLRAYDRFLGGEESGCIAEISTDTIYLREAPEYADESQRWLAENLGDVHNKVKVHRSP